MHLPEVGLGEKLKFMPRGVRDEILKVDRIVDLGQIVVKRQP